MSVRSLTWDEVRRRRLTRSHLLEPAPLDRLVEVVREVGGIHAQVTASAELSISARVAGVTRQDVREALWERRVLVKTWSLRGTLHLHPADELPLWMAARRAVTGPDDGGSGAAPERLEEVVQAIGEALEAGPLLREELADEVVRRVGGWPREKLASGWGFFLGDAAAAGLLCHGPPRGQKVTFVRPGRWLGRWEDADPEQALADVCRRYVASYGPVSPQSFRAWLAARRFDAAEARRLFEALGDELEAVEVEGKRAWILRGDEDGFEAVASVRLLPEYDCYMMGFREREQFIGPEARERLRDHARGRLEGPSAVAWILVDGRVGGIWRRQRRGKRAEVEAEPFGRLDRRRREQLDAEVERVRGFLER